MNDGMDGAYEYSIDKVSGDKGEDTIIRFLETQHGLKFIRKSRL